MTGTPHTSGEQGMALVVGLAVLVVVGLLAAVGIETAIRTNRITRSDAGQKAALAAADAGLAVATYRLNMLAPDATHCVTTAVVAAAGGLCPVDGPEALGNGASFNFQATTVLAGGSCAGQAMANSQQTVAARCISAIGTASGVSVRTQAQVDSFAAQPFFPEPGIVGLNGVTVGNNATVNAVAGTNGVLTLANNTTVNALRLQHQLPVRDLDHTAEPTRLRRGSDRNLTDRQQRHPDHQRQADPAGDAVRHDVRSDLERRDAIDRVRQ